MEMTDNMDRFTESLSQAMMHSIWQGLLLVCLLMIALRFMAKRSAQERYVAALLALGLQFTLFATTFAWLFQHWEGSPVVHEMTEITSTEFVPLLQEQPNNLWGEVEAFYGKMMELAKQYNYEVVIAWLLGMALLSLRFASGLYYIEKLKQKSYRTIPLKWQCRLDNLADQMGIGKKVVLAESGSVTVPTLVGWLRPVVLVPVSMLSQMTVHEIDAILAHELAHVKRHDYFVNLLQSLVEIVLFFNPTTWWITACINEERENCCDDLALTQARDQKTYIQALAGLAKGFHTPKMALSAAGNKGSVLFRIKRIMSKTNNQPSKGHTLARHIASRSVAAMIVMIFGAFVMVNTGFTSPQFDLPSQKQEVLLSESDTTKKIRVFFSEGDSIIRVERTDGKQLAEFKYKLSITVNDDGSRSSTMNIDDGEYSDDYKEEAKIYWLGSGSEKALQPNQTVEFDADSLVWIELPVNGKDERNTQVIQLRKVEESNVQIDFTTDSIDLAGHKSMITEYHPKLKQLAAGQVMKTEKIKTIRFKVEKGEPSYLLDGEEVDKEIIKALSPDEIATVDVRKGDNEQDVVTIVTKSNATKQVEEGQKANDRVQITTIKISTLERGDPLLVLDGEEKNMNELNKLVKPNDIKSIEVLKGEEAIKRFGKKAKFGAILITTKSAGEENKEEEKEEPEVEGVYEIREIKNELILLDGEAISEKEMEETEPESIKAIEIMKGEAATAIYGESGKDGVIMIRLKEKHKELPPPPPMPVVVEGKKVVIVEGKEVVEPTPPIDDFSKGIKVYPNPSDSDFTVDFNLEMAAEVKVTVSDLSGKELAVLANEKLGQGTHRFTWRPGEQPNGLYMVNIFRDGEVYQSKVVLSKE